MAVPPVVHPAYISSSGVMAANIVLPILAIIVVSLRLFARRVKSQPLKADDYAIIFALAICVAVCSISIYGASTRMYGQLLTTMKPAQFIKFRKVLFYDILFSYLAYGVIKLSVILFYKRIFCTQRFFLLANIVMAMCVGFTFAACFGQIFSSNPISNRWKSKSTWGAVIDYPAFMVSMAAIDIFLDLIVLALPLPNIWKLHVDTKKKIQIVAIFLLGGFCVVATSVRLYYIHQLLYTLTLAPIPRTRISNLNIIWGHTEACASVIAACLPTMGPIFQHGRSLQSILNSARSVFSASSNLSLGRKSQESTSISDSTRKWEQTNPTTAHTSTRTPNSTRGDLESQTSKNDGIVVEKSLSQQAERY